MVPTRKALASGGRRAAVANRAKHSYIGVEIGARRNRVGSLIFRRCRVRSNRSAKMARKPGARAEFVLFDVLYEDGSQRSNRKVPSDVLGGLDGDAPARTVIEDQDRAIAEKSGVPPIPIKNVRRSGGKG